MSELKGEYIVKLTGDFEGVEMDSQDKEYLIKRISKAFFRMNNLKPNKKAIVKYKVMVIAKTSDDDSI